MVPHTLLLLADAKPGGAFSDIAFLLPGFIAVFYFLVLRPQQKEQKKQQETISALKKGDDVITSGGVFGKVFSVSDRDVMLEVAQGVKLRILKTSIQGKVPVAAEAKADKPDEAQIKKEEK